MQISRLRVECQEHRGHLLQHHRTHTTSNVGRHRVERSLRFQVSGIMGQFKRTGHQNPEGTSMEVIERHEENLEIQHVPEGEDILLPCDRRVCPPVWLRGMDTNASTGEGT